jgi:hypothetical protein
VKAQYRYCFADAGQFPLTILVMYKPLKLRNLRRCRDAILAPPLRRGQTGRRGSYVRQRSVLQPSGFAMNTPEVALAAVLIGAVLAMVGSLLRRRQNQRKPQPWHQRKRRNHDSPSRGERK